MKIQFWLGEDDADSDPVGEPRTTDFVPRVGDTVALSDDDVYTVRSVHWYFHAGEKPSVIVMLDP